MFTGMTVVFNGFWMGNTSSEVTKRTTSFVQRNKNKTALDFSKISLKENGRETRSFNVPR
jgi:hypothetical protein